MGQKQLPLVFTKSLITAFIKLVIYKAQYKVLSSKIIWKQFKVHPQFSIKDFFSKRDQIRRKLWIWSHLLKKFSIENYIFCEVAISSFILSPISLLLHMINKRWRISYNLENINNFKRNNLTLKNMKCLQ